jgi:hypothetical protein
LANGPDELHPPTHEEWSRFVAKLRVARAAQLSAARATDLPDGVHADFPAVWHAYEAVLELLIDQPDVVADKLAEPLVHLGFALGDLVGGRAHPLLRPHRRPDTATSKGGKATSELALMACAAIALDALIEADEPRHDAARKVARAIVSAHIPVRSRGDAVLTSTILGWRDRLSEGKDAAPKQALRIWAAYRANRHRDGVSPRDRAEKLLRDLRDNPAYRYA